MREEDPVSNTKEELATIHYRSWSSPACTLSHLSQRLLDPWSGEDECEPELAVATSSTRVSDLSNMVKATAAVGNPRLPTSMAIFSMFPCCVDNQPILSLATGSGVDKLQISFSSPNEQKFDRDGTSSDCSSTRSGCESEKHADPLEEAENLVNEDNCSLKQVCETLKLNLRQLKADSERQMQELRDKYSTVTTRCEELERENKELRVQQTASRSQIQLLMDSNKAAMEHCEELEKEKEELAFELDAEREKNEKLQEEVASLQNQCYEQFDIMNQCNHLMELHAATGEKP